MAGNRTGSVLSSDPRAQAQAASIGATIGPDGWWTLNGKRLSPQEADRLVNAAGSGVGGLSDEGHGAGRGFLGETYDRNKSWIDPVAIGTASAFGGPLGGALASGGLKYANTHDLGKSALSAAGGYGAGKLAGGLLSKIPGAQAVTDKLKGLTIPGMGGVSDALKSALSPKGLGAAGDFLTGNNGLNALGLAQGANAAYLGQKAGNFADLAAKGADERWRSQAPLRQKGIAGLLTPQPIDVSGLEAQRRVGNPFAVAPLTR